MLPTNHAKYVEFVVDELVKKTKHNKTTLESIAKKQFNILDQNNIKELTELAIVMRAKFLANQPGKSIKQKYFDIVELYKSQVNLSHRTSQSMLLQQYSTPAPIGYIAGIYLGLHNFGTENKQAFEPSAGNGLLTVAIDNPKHCTVNEIDDFRLNNLQTQGFKKATQFDATLPFSETNTFDAIITNPPFGRSPRLLEIDGYKFNTLEQVMALNALNLLKNDGKAAIIIGGHTTWDSEGRIQAGKNRIFFSYLYAYYNVEDVILIDGHQLYSRQGTAFDTRLILINGRKATPEGYAPLFNAATDKVVNTFEDLFNRIALHFKVKFETTTPKTMNKNFELEAEALALELDLLNL